VEGNNGIVQKEGGGRDHNGNHDGNHDFDHNFDHNFDHVGNHKRPTPLRATPQAAVTTSFRKKSDAKKGTTSA
jgi:hypothetical protein